MKRSSFLKMFLGLFGMGTVAATTETKAYFNNNAICGTPLLTNDDPVKDIKYYQNNFPAFANDILGVDLSNEQKAILSKLP